MRRAAFLWWMIGAALSLSVAALVSAPGPADGADADSPGGVSAER